MSELDLNWFGVEIMYFGTKKISVTIFHQKLLISRPPGCKAFIYLYGTMFVRGSFYFIFLIIRELLWAGGRIMSMVQRSSLIVWGNSFSCFITFPVYAGQPCSNWNWSPHDDTFTNTYNFVASSMYGGVKQVISCLFKRR